MKTRLGTTSDISEVLALQELNLHRNLTEKELEKGFVTTPFTIHQIEQIIKEEGLFIAEDENEIVGYAFAAGWDYFKQWDIFPFMTSRFPNLTFKDWNITTKNSFQYGPVCIASAYRGKNILNLIFEEMRIHLAKKYPLSITFINTLNPRSLKAHTKKLGWVVIDEFEFNQNTYWGLAFDMKNSVVIK